MTDSASSAALARIARALDRIEAASGGGESAPALAALEQRHAALRGRVQETIARLDAMIGTPD